jgi:pyruvate/2-oxoglutarate/acetoin dehydrogenase E1 component
MIKAALRGEDPVIFLMHKNLSGVRGPVGGPEDLVLPGSAAVIREGSDMTIVAYSGMVARSLKAAEGLAESGISAEVIDLRWVAPIDVGTIARSVMKTGRALVASEAPGTAGIAAEVAAAIGETVFDYLDKPVLRVAARHAPVPHSPPLIDAVTPQVADIEQAARQLMDDPSYGGTT